MVDSLVDSGCVSDLYGLQVLRQRRREADFALLCSTGKPISGNYGFASSVSVTIIAELPGKSTRRAGPDSGGAMDLAMAMGMTLFGMFAGSTVYFFYKLER